MFDLHIIIENQMELNKKQESTSLTEWKYEQVK